MLGRALAQKLAEQMGQPVIADNRPGAGGNLGLELGAKAPPDGHTMVLSSPLQPGISVASLLKALSFNTIEASCRVAGLRLRPASELVALPELWNVVNVALRCALLVSWS